MGGIPLVDSIRSWMVYFWLFVYQVGGVPLVVHVSGGWYTPGGPCIRWVVYP